jgi:hypothetical protein
MSLEQLSTDTLEQRLAANGEARSRLDAEDLAILEVLDARQMATGDGCRSLSDWVAARLDLDVDRARALVRTMRRTTDRGDLRAALADGVSLDRVEAVSRIPEDVGLLEHMDVAGVRREAARQAGISAEVEQRNAGDRFLVLQPSLDESWWRIWGGLDGYAGSIVDKVLTETADQLPEDGPTGDGSWRRATALIQLCVSDDPPPAQVTVIVDAKHATGTNGKAGVVVEAGPVVGRRALEAVLCDAVTEVIVRNTDGRYMDYGYRHRVVPPALRRALIDKYSGACAIDGCASRNRLQAHHIIPWSQGGPTNQDNLILVCWFHHHIAIHERGLHLYQHPDHGRVRLRQPALSRGP